MCGMCEAAFGRGSVQQCWGCLQAQGYVDDEESLQLLLRWTSAFCKVLMWHVREDCDLESELQVCHVLVVLATGDIVLWTVRLYALIAVGSSDQLLRYTMQVCLSTSRCAQP